jgi:hypothetical protein
LDDGLGAFEDNFYACIAQVAHIPRQPILHGEAVHKGAKTHTLNNPCNAKFNTQSLNLSYVWVEVFSYTFLGLFNNSLKHKKE